MLCYVRRSFAWWDERTVARLRGSIWEMVMKQLGGREAMHGFTYVPEVGKTTVGEEGGGGKERRSWLGGLERRGVVVLGILMGVGWVCLRGLIREMG